MKNLPAVILLIFIIWFSSQVFEKNHHYESGMHYQSINGDVVNITEDSLRVALLKNQYNILK